MMQNEKRKMLTEHETLKLKELDEAYSAEVKDWKAQLKPRKQVGKQDMANYEVESTSVYYCCRVRHRKKRTSVSSFFSFSFSFSRSSSSSRCFQKLSA